MPASSIQAGCTGDFMLLGEIARGASGVVWHAVRISLNRPCALKFLLEGHLASETDRARFKAEAEATAALDHPAIVRIYGSGDLDGHPYLEMELLSGETLADRMAAQPPSWPQCAQWLQILAEGLAHAHARGVLHRDIKPSNILLTPEGLPKLGDFGLARMLARPANLTVKLGVIGTPTYLAPEIAREGSRAASTASDLFSLGAVFHEMLVGQPPRPGTDPVAVLSQAEKQPLPPPGRLRPGIPANLDVLCQRCTVEDPTRRIPSARHLADELQRHLDGKPIQSRPPALLERLILWTARHRARAVILALATLAVLVSASVTAWSWQKARERDAQFLARSILRSVANNEDIAREGDASDALLGMANTLRRFPDHDPTRQRLAHWLSLPDFCLTPLRFWPHESGARKAAYSGDEQWIWVALEDGRVVVHPAPNPAASPSPATRHLPVAFAISNVGPESLAGLNHDGSRLLAWHADRRLVQWIAPAQSNLPPTVDWQLPDIVLAALSTDRSHWAALSRDGRLWSASILSNAPPKAWEIPPTQPTGGILAIANSGDVIALSPDGHRIQIHRAKTSKANPKPSVGSLPGDYPPLSSLSLSSRGSYVLAVAGRTWRTWATREDLDDPSPPRFAPQNSIVALNEAANQVVMASPGVGVSGRAIRRSNNNFSPVKSRILDFTDMALGSSPQVAVVTRRGQLLQKRTRDGNFSSSAYHRSPARAVAFSPSGTRILVAHADGFVLEFPTIPGLTDFPCQSLGADSLNALWTGAVGPVGPVVLSSAGALHAWNPAEPSSPPNLSHIGPAPRILAHVPAIKGFLGVTDDPAVVEVIQPDPFTRSPAWTAPEPVVQLWAHPSLPHAMAAGTNTLSARFGNGGAWLDLGSFPIPVRKVLFHPRKPEAILLDPTGKAFRWIARGATSAVTAFPTPFPIATADVTPDGARILWVSRGPQARLADWDRPVETGHPCDAISEIRSHALLDTHVAIATERAVTVWRMDDMEKPVPLAGPFRPIHAVAMAPDARQIAIHSDIHWIRFHDTETGERMGRVYNLHGPSLAGGPWNIRYHPGGKHVWGWSSKGGIFSLPQPARLPSIPAWTPVLIDLAEHIAQDPIPTDLPTRQSRLQRLRSARTQGLWRPEWDRYLGEE